jgi:hypothetical protein
MSFSFSETLETDLDWIRFRLDDVTDGDYRLSDETIQALIDMYDVQGALIFGCERILNFYAKEPTQVRLVSGFQVTFGNLASIYRDLLATLKSEDGSGGGKVGTLDFSVADKIALAANKTPYDPTEKAWATEGVRRYLNGVPNR